MVLLALEAAEELAKRSIDAEVIDPRTLKPLDIQTIVRSVQKTARLVVVNEGHLTGGFTAEIAARLQREAFDWLDAPIMQVATEDVPLPYAGPLELEALPDVEDIVNAVQETLPGARR
jgi:pyruvate/2-oxoglutarate/acetoin dehydrogenase E1 component